MLSTFSELTECRVSYNGTKVSVSLIYGEKKKKRQRRKTRAPGTTQAAIPSATSPQAQTSQPGAGRKDASTKPKPSSTANQPPVIGPSYPSLGAPVELSTKEPVVPKRKATSPLQPHNHNALVTLHSHHVGNLLPTG